MKALLIVDMQNDFMPNGALPVPGSNELIKGINELQREFTWVLASKDFHPKNHISFRTKDDSDKWPEHCLQGSFGAAFAEGLDTSKLVQVFLKGVLPAEDSYSAFYEGLSKKKSDLADFLIKNAIRNLTIVGVALDFCVQATALDSIRLGFETVVLKKYCKGIGAHESIFENLTKNGVKII